MQAKSVCHVSHVSIHLFKVSPYFHWRRWLQVFLPSEIKSQVLGVCLWIRIDAFLEFLAYSQVTNNSSSHHIILRSAGEKIKQNL